MQIMSSLIKDFIVNWFILHNFISLDNKKENL